MLLSGRVDISRTYCIIRNEVFFLRSSRGRLREKVTEKLLIERKKERKRERERKRGKGKYKERSVNVVSGEV